jgi:hypothetical protein
MVAIPIPHPSQSPQSYRVRFQESYAEPFAPQDYGTVPPAPAAAPESTPAAAQAAAMASVSASAEAVVAVLKEQDWINILAAGTLLAGGALLVSGHKRTGLVIAAAGTALALVEEKEALESLWKNIPGYLKEAQSFLDKAEGYLKDFSTNANKLNSSLR